jgi:hypothetical protein
MNREFTPHCKERGQRAFASLSTITLTLQFVILGIIFASFAANLQSPPSETWTVGIVLPPKLVAGQTATLAALGRDGKMAQGITIHLDGMETKTDSAGRAFFTVASNRNYLIAKSAGSSSAAVIESPSLSGTATELSVPTFLSIQDRFQICGGGFRGDADSNQVTLNGEPVFVMASSPECLVVFPGPKAEPGPAKIVVETDGKQRSATTNLVSLSFDSPDPPPVAQKRSRLAVRVNGTEQPLSVKVENESPVVLHFVKGETQIVRTSGGVPNTAAIEVEAIRSGDYSFRASIPAAENRATAERYLEAARAIAPPEFQSEVKELAKRLSRNPHDASKVRRELERIATGDIAGDFYTLLQAARDAL